MREEKLQLSLNQTQKVRLQSALQTLEGLSSTSTASSVTVADTIPLTNEDLELHGTLELNGEVVATLCGLVERGNKLVYVRSLRARYEPKVEDIIVGRVLEIAPKRWRLEINFSQDAMLMLSSMNFPDGIQRRRTAVDELNMHSIFKENDVVCAEVHGCQHDGSLQLRVRSQKYGKLENGQLLSVPAYLVKQCKHHFHHLNKYGVDLIIGCNGFIWVGKHVEVRENTMLDDHESKELEQRVMPLEIRHNICRIANSVRLLSALGFTLSLEVIASTVEASLSANVAIKDMLGAEFCVVTAEREVQRRTSKRKKRRIFV